jgi:AraC family transcriptional regulator
MEPVILECSQRILLGLGFFGDPFTRSGGWSEENEIGRLWKRFMTYLTEHPGEIGQVKIDRVMYELHIYGKETQITGEFEVFVGVEVEALETMPLELSVKVLPPAAYAVFTLRGEQITSDWAQMIYTDWAPGSGYQVIQTHSLQRYDERFKGLAQMTDSALEVYIPVARLPTAAQATRP